MRTTILYRLAAGTCGICLCYGLVVQALTGEVSTEASALELSAWEAVQTAEPAETREQGAYSFETQPAAFLPSEGRGKRHGNTRYTQPAESYASAESEEDKTRVTEEDPDSGDDSTQQTNSAGDPPTLSQFLSTLRCGGCRHNCCLLSPRCMKGRSKQQSATVQYTQTYGG